MITILKTYHVIHNFPKNYPYHKKIFANLMFLLGGIIIHPRKNLLTNKDLMQARSILRRGDIILAGNLRTFYSLTIKEPVTHSGLYVGGNKIIHSIPDGVKYLSLHKLFTDYDTLAILRLPGNVKNRRNIIRDAIYYAKTEKEKPYDFDFKKGIQSFFCTKLVNESFKQAGYDSGLVSIKRPNNKIEKLKKHFTGAVEALHPFCFLNGNFNIVFVSHNLAFEGKKLKFIND